MKVCPEQNGLMPEHTHIVFEGRNVALDLGAKKLIDLALGHVMQRNSCDYTSGDTDDEQFADHNYCINADRISMRKRRAGIKTNNRHYGDNRVGIISSKRPKLFY
jgi:hypothetical protein